MKSRILLAVLLAVLLAAAGVLNGAWRALNTERAQIEQTYGAPLRERLALREQTVQNLIALSGHYQADTALIAALQSADYTALPAAFEALAGAVENSPSLSGDPIDPTLLQLLRSEFAAREADGEFTAYNEAAAAYNARLETDFSARLARRVLGVEPLKASAGRVSAPAVIYPEKPMGAVYDGANVLSDEIMTDAATLSSELESKLSVRVYVVSVRFLDGERADVYAQTLAARWLLKDSDVLVLMSVGDRASCVYAGKDAVALLDNQQDALRVQYFEGDFKARAFDSATRSLLSAVSKKLSSRNHIAVDTVIAATAAPTLAPVASPTPRATAAPRATVRPVRYEEESDMPSFGAVVVLIILVVIVLGRRGSRVGCGCLPFAGLLALFSGNRGHDRTGGHHFGNGRPRH